MRLEKQKGSEIGETKKNWKWRNKRELKMDKQKRIEIGETKQNRD
jgi:hypothetical protein